MQTNDLIAGSPDIVGRLWQTPLKPGSVTPAARPRSTIAATEAIIERGYRGEAPSFCGTTLLCVTMSRTLELLRRKCWKRSALRCRSREIGAAVDDQRSAREIWKTQQKLGNTTSIF